MSCKICDQLKDKATVMLLDNYNMHIAITKKPKKFILTATSAPLSQGLSDYGQVRITHCPKCGAKL